MRTISRRWRLAVAAAVPLLCAAAIALASRAEPRAPTFAPAPPEDSDGGDRAEVAPVDLTAATEVGRFRLSHYWIVDPPRLEIADDDRTYPVYDPSCQEITRLPGKARRRIRLEGTARLPDGSVINLHGKCKCGAFPCFVRVDPTRPFGLGVKGHHLDPFRTVAVDPRFVRIGTPIYVAELDGLQMPGGEPFGGYVHDGCVVAADRGRGIRGNKIDFFVGSRDNYRELRETAGLKRVHLYRNVPRCLERTPRWSPEALESVLDVVALAETIAVKELPDD